ncbi:methylated-DNA--[protein]-cysteine S-methyltransferase [Chloroflexota bacterium]
MPRGIISYVFETAAGWVGLSASESGLRQLTLPMGTAAAARQQLGVTGEDLTGDSRFIDDAMPRLSAYFRGNRISFPDKLDLSPATAFQRRVWQETKNIPYGETRTYGWIAAQIGQPGAARAVGQALGRNPLPIIIPCHRVLGAGGNLGSFTGGIRWKKYLLELESSYVK